MGSYWKNHLDWATLMAHPCLLVNKVSHSLLIREFWAPLKLIFRLGTYLERCRVERKRMNASNMSVLFLMRIGHRLDQLEPNLPRRLPLGRPCRYMWQELFPSWSPPITNLLQEVPGIITKTEHRFQTKQLRIGMVKRWSSWDFFILVSTRLESLVLLRQLWHILN